MNRSRKTGDLVSQNNLFVDIANDRIGIGSTIPGNKLSLPDSAKIGLGNAEDLTLYHDGNNSFIDESTGTGSLYVRTNALVIQKGGGTESMARFLSDGAVELNHNNLKKFETTSSGITVTGSQVLTLPNDHNEGITFTQTNSKVIGLLANAARSGASQGILDIRSQWSGDTVAKITTTTVGSTSSKGAEINFSTATAGGSATERLTITSLGNVRLPNDSQQLQIGASQDIQIFHNGTDSVIYNATGNLDLRSNGTIELQASDGSEIYAKFVRDAECSLWHNNIQKFETTSSGIKLQSGLTSGNGMSNMLQLDNDGNSNGDGSYITFSRAGYLRSKIGAIKNETANNETDIVFETTLAGSIGEKVRITSAGRVGINRTTPRTLLDLGLGTDASTLSNTAADYQLGLHAAQSTTGDIGRNIAFISQTQGTVCAAINTVDNGTSDSTALQFVTGTSSSIAERVRIDSSGRVLIGTTNAGTSAQMLTIYRTGTSALEIRSGTSSNCTIHFTDGDPPSGNASYRGFIEYKHGDDDMRFATAASERLRITSVGNVGIGTEDPDTVLHLMSTNPTIKLTDENQAADNKDWNITAGQTQVLRIQSLNDAGSGGGSLFDFYRNGNNVQEFRGRSSGNTWFTVKNSTRSVGINTDNPANKLTVWADDSDVDTDVFQIRGKTGAFNIRVNDADAANPEWAIRTYASEPIVFMQGTTERARITSAGKVLIGTTTPQGNANADDLVVSTSGHSGITIRSGTSHNSNLFFADGTSGGDEYRGWVDYKHNDNSMSFGTNATERLRIDSNGRLLIGTTSNRQTRLGTNTIPPDLQIESDSVAAFSMTRWNTGTSPSRLILQKGRGTTASPAVVADGDQSGQILFNAWDGDTFTNTAQIRSVVDGTPGDDQMPGMLVFATNSGGTGTTTRMTIKADGKIGMNVTEPTTNLQIGSTTVDSDNVITLGKRVTCSETNLPKIGHHSDNAGSSGLALCATSSSGKIHFFTGNGGNGFGASSNAERMRITSGGNIGIGTVSPQERLHLYAGNCALEVDAPANRYCSVGFSVDGASKWWMGRGDSDVLSETSFFIGKDAGSATDKGGNSAKFVIDTNGKIGIANDAPLYSMHFKNAMASSPSWIHMEVTGSNAVGGGGGIAFDTSASNSESSNTLYLATIAGIRNSDDDGSNDLVFSTSRNGVNSNLPLEKLRINSHGRVLIGHSSARIATSTINPFFQLEGTNYNASLSVIRNSANAHAPYLILGKSRSGAVGGYTILQDNDVLGAIRFAGADGTDMVQYGGEIQVEVDGTPAANSMPGAMVFKTNSGSGNPSERLRITNTQIVAGSGVVMRANDGFVSDTSLILKSDHNANGGTNDNIIFQNGGTELARLKGTGRFGIGTASPDTELHILNTSADAAITVEATASGKDSRLNLYAHNTGVSQIRLGDDTDTNIGRITYYHAASGSYQANTLDFIAGDVSRVRIESSGLVLPQTTNEIRTNSSDGSDNKRIILAAGGDNSQTRGAQIAMYGNEYSSHQGRLQLLAGNSGNTNGVVQIYTGGSERVHIASNGKVGINETAPLARLHVKNGESSATGYAHDTIVVEDSDHAYLTFLTGTSGGAGINFGDSGSAQRGVIEYSHNDDYMRFITSQGERLRLQSSGMNSSVNLGFGQVPHGDYFIDILNNDSAHGMRLRSTGSTYHDIVFDANRDNGEQALGRIVGKWNGNVVAYMQVQSGISDGNKNSGRIKFYTADEGGGGAKERMEILPDGQVQIGNANEVQLTASNKEMLYLHGAVTDPNADHAWGMNIDMDDDAGGTATADRERGCIHCDFHGNSFAGDTSNEMRIWNLHSDVEVNGDYDSVIGMYSDIMHSSTGGTTSTNIWGMYGYVQKNNNGGVGNMYGMYAISQQSTGSSGNVADMVGIRARVNQCAGSGSGTATDIMAVWANIDNDRGNNAAQPSGGKCALLYGSYDTTTGLSNPHGVYIATDVPNYFKGPVKINSTDLTGGDSNAGQTPELYVDGYSNLGGLRIKGGDTGNTIYKEGGNLSITVGTGHHMYFKTNGTDRLEIDENGQMFGSATTDGVLNLSTTNGAGSFIRFQQNDTSKAWVGCSEGLGAGDQDDLGLRAVDKIIFLKGGTARAYFDSSGNFIPWGNNTYHLGSTSDRWKRLYSNNAINTSDKNEKNTIVDCTLGLDFIKKLKPVSYKWNEDDGKTHYGLIAQDVEKAVIDSGMKVEDFGSIDVPERLDTYNKDGREVTERYGLAYAEFTAPLIKSIQELSMENTLLKTEISQLTTLLDELKVRLDNAGL